MAKVKNDRVDSRKIADLLRCNLFPLAYNYPKGIRPTRDLLRRRHFFMWRRASTYSHLQVICTQHGIIDLEPKIVKDKQRRNQLLKLFDDKELQMMISLDLKCLEGWK